MEMILELESMGGPLDTWRVHGWFDEVEIEIDPGRVDRDAMQKSITELTKLLEAMGYPAQAREALHEIHARLHGVPWIARSSEMATFDLGSPRVRTFADDLLLAVRIGRLVVRRVDRPRALQPAGPELPISKLRPIPPPPEDELPEAPTGWIAVVLQDGQGHPVAGQQCVVTTCDGATRPGVLSEAGLFRVDEIPWGTCRIAFPDLEATEWQPGAKPSDSGRTATIQQGDHVPGLAAQAGFGTYKTVWEHPQNAELKSARASPGILLPGDSVFVPKKQSKPLSRACGNTWTFTLKRDQVRLRVEFLDATRQPLAGTSCSVQTGSASDSTTTDGQGQIDQPIDAATDDVSVTVGSLAFTTLVGGLDPFDTPSGVAARLRNLGYDVSDVSDDDFQDTLAWAVEEFQCDNGLPLTGTGDSSYYQQVKDAYGC